MNLMNSRVGFRSFLCSWVLVLGGCFSPSSDSDHAPQNSRKDSWTTGRHEWTGNGLKRSFWLDVPESRAKDAALVFVFHGYTGSAESIRESSGFSAVAEEHGFVVAYPQGTIDSRGNAFFNVGYSFHQNSSVDDVRFVRELAAALVDDLGLNPNAIFSTGMSNGGDMSYFLASRPDPFVRAIAPVAGTMMVAGHEGFIPRKRVPVMEVHGTDDSITRWAGDLEDADGWGAYFGTLDVMRLWTDGYELEHSESTFFSQPSSEQKPIRLHRWWTSRDDTEVVLYEIQGGKHVWPESLGRKGISLAEEIWMFLQKYE
jgi:polyhydroxybutyrate depolymerase